jgi:hypothetical protein
LKPRQSQAWGSLGIDTAAVPPDGRKPTPIRIGEKVYEKGLGHHAGGEIVLDLDGRYLSFEADVGVQWQGGNRGSVVFQVIVDGKMGFESSAMSDSDSPKHVSLSLVDARELRLVAEDAGDGISCDMATWADARLTYDSTLPEIGPPHLFFDGEPAPPPGASVCGFSLIAGETGPQVALLGPENRLVACTKDGEEIGIEIPIGNILKPFSVSLKATLLSGEEVSLSLSVDGEGECVRTLASGSESLQVSANGGNPDSLLRLGIRGGKGESAIRWSDAQLVMEDRTFEIPLSEEAPDANNLLLIQPPLRPSIERELIEWDWRMQDGIGTQRVPVTYEAAIEKVLERGQKLIDDLSADGLQLESERRQCEGFRREWEHLRSAGIEECSTSWEELWKVVHWERRRMVFRNPLADTGPVLFVKQVPSSFSHQLTQYYGRYARPGGGVFVLDTPGESLSCRQLAEDCLPEGSYQHPEVSYDGQRVLFAYCQAESSPEDSFNGHHGRYYHLYEMASDGSGLRQLTEGPYDDFSPRYLPDGKIVFTSTRRGGWHRCGTPGCEVYTLATLNADGSDAKTVSYHETQEWDPAVLGDGRVIYTRWDYVDRNAVHYQQLWTVRPDGSLPRIFYGNNTFNPVGVWEARSVPGSDKVMATAAAHHAMTAGSIILLDVNKGVDGLDPITRLTPDALFPESETIVAPRSWHAPGSPQELPPIPAEAARWPGHCYRSPYPLSEKFFLAAYSFDELIGEPDANPANMFGIYLVDSLGNKELLYRDLNIASLWPVPLRSRPRPPILSSAAISDSTSEGTFFLQNVYESAPLLTAGSVKNLRIVQVLPKSTPGANRPMVGLANASPGKQVLGTVPVEPDGSAFFRAPAGIPLAFQALDEMGQAVQTMRSVTYLQPGENASCVGCHEPRTSAPPPGSMAQALGRGSSRIAPAPDGANPLSYPLLVQPVLDRHCVECHDGSQGSNSPSRPALLSGVPEGHYSASYNALAPRVSYTAWGLPGDFRVSNCEPLTQPDFFGARASALMKMLIEGHQEVELDPEDVERLVTWMDANALFYGTFNMEDQARQQRGERIEGPGVE